MVASFFSLSTVASWPLHVQASSSAPPSTEAAPTAASRALAFVSRALASAHPTTKPPNPSPTHSANDPPHPPELASDSPHSLQPRNNSSASLGSPLYTQQSQHAVMPSSHSSASMDWPQQRTWPTAASSSATTPGLEPAGSRETEKSDASPQREAAFRGGATNSGNSHLPEEPMGSTVPFQSDRLPEQEASFRDWPSGGSLPEAAPPDSFVGQSTHGQSGQSESSHIPVDDSHQHDRMAASVLPIVQQEEQLLPQVVQQPPQQPRQLQQQLSGNPFSDTMPSPFASSSHKALEAGSVPDTSSGSTAHSHIMPENDVVPAAQAQQAGVVYGGDEDTMHAMPALQPVSQGELSSMPSLAQMLSDLHPAGKHRLMLSVVVQANEVSILGMVQSLSSCKPYRTNFTFLS